MALEPDKLPLVIQEFASQMAAPDIGHQHAPDLR